MDFSTKQVVQLTGATARMLAHWDRTGLLKPSARRASGKGSRRRYSFTDVVALKAVKQLRNRNCPLKEIRAAVAHIRKTCPEQSAAQTLAQSSLVTDGKKVMVVRNGNQLIEVISRQTVWCVPLGKLIVDAAKAIETTGLNWSESLRVHGEVFQIDVSRENPKKHFVAQCHQFPAIVCDGKTPQGAIEEVRVALMRFLRTRQLQRARFGVAV